MVKKILQIGNPILNNQTKEVKQLDETVNSVIQDLLDTAKSKKEITAGLAAPQIGESYSICVCRRVDLENKYPDISDEELWEVMINPKLISQSQNNSTYWEACLSVGVGADSLFAPVSRSNSVMIEFLDRNMQPKQLKATNFFSHEVQHEIDHLHGVLFLKYVKDPANIWKKNKIDAYFDEYGEYPLV